MSKTNTDTAILSLQAQLAAMQAENERLKASMVKTARISFKVSEKGAVSAYGLGRFPVTLYGSQWVKLVEALPALQEFIKANAALLSVKEASAATPVATPVVK